jgi:hypothetical protein
MRDNHQLLRVNRIYFDVFTQKCQIRNSGPPKVRVGFKINSRLSGMM